MHKAGSVLDAGLSVFDAGLSAFCAGLLVLGVGLSVFDVGLSVFDVALAIVYDFEMFAQWVVRFVEQWIEMNKLVLHHDYSFLSLFSRGSREEK